ncbi:hypothetical protein BB560_003228 [Smittium megazygosporum]|uniref:Mtf2-like C-terminal domain-containing protein n=1 Tax=Smittium megazygosporum TaxID=133381 RepID=A0A2T9ZCN3_9FUNG|nr:hypothetical protein BB560_003228 [Smittium megazygosporum]
MCFLYRTPPYKLFLPFVSKTSCVNPKTILKLYSSNIPKKPTEPPFNHDLSTLEASTFDSSTESLDLNKDTENPTSINSDSLLESVSSHESNQESVPENIIISDFEKESQSLDYSDSRSSIPPKSTNEFHLDPKKLAESKVLQNSEDNTIDNSKGPLNIFDVDQLLSFSVQSPNRLSSPSSLDNPSLFNSVEHNPQTQTSATVNEPKKYTILDKIVLNKDNEQLNLSEISMISNMSQLSEFVQKKMFPPSPSKSKSLDHHTLLGQKKISRRLILTSNIAAKAVSTARQMKCIHIIYYIYNKLSMLPLEKKLDVFDSDSYFEFIKSSWELTNDLDMVINFLSESIVSGIVFNEPFIDLLISISAEIQDKDAILPSHQKLKILIDKARLSM